VGFHLFGVVLFGAMATLSLGACSGSSTATLAANTQTAGEVGLDLIVGDLSVTSVHYTVTNGVNSYAGDIDVSDAGDLTAVIGGVVAGSGYNIVLTAVSGTAQCIGSAGPVTVTANQTIRVSVELRCQKPRDRGSVLINGTTNACPDIAAVTTDPPDGCSISLHVSATDDGKPSPPGTLQYDWTTEPELVGANPTFQCRAPGPQPLWVTISDGDSTCDETFALTLLCPESCPVAPPTCSDGIQDAGETGVDCGGPCASCGANMVRVVASKGVECLMCAQANCFDSFDNNACDAISGVVVVGGAQETKASLCLSLLSCEISTNCGKMLRAFGCLCGGGPLCVGQGPCWDQEMAALEAGNGGEAQLRLGNTAYAGGRANRLIDCMKDNGCDSCFQ
jgi:hypothetical protein